jgi:transposase InsO family protein
MRLHRNAKTTPLMRQLIVDRVTRQHWTQARAAEAAGISVRTVAKWVARWRAGDRACGDESSRPQGQPRRLKGDVRAAIVQLRQTRATAWQISAALRVPRSTVTRVLHHAGLNRLATLEPLRIVRRYEWPHAGDLLHVDIKPLGRIRGIGHRITGDRQRPQPGSGWEYVHVAIDDATRLAYVEVRRSQRRHACARFLRRAVQWFARRGIRVQRVLTDNGSGYRSRLWAAACRAWTLRHKRTRPYTPRTNGKAERFIQTLLREWAYRWPYLTSETRTAALTGYLQYYNRQRPHASLGRRSPWTRFQEAA